MTTHAEQTVFDWMYPQIGTCGEPCDELRICLHRVRAVNDIVIKFDGARDAWVIGAYYAQDKDGELPHVFKTMHLVPEQIIEPDYFLK